MECILRPTMPSAVTHVKTTKLLFTSWQAAISAIKDYKPRLIRGGAPCSTDDHSTSTYCTLHNHENHFCFLDDKFHHIFSMQLYVL